MATGDHGNARCAARPDPASWSHLPESKPEEAAKKAAARPAAGAPRRPSRKGARGRQSQLGVGPPTARASVHQFVSPSIRQSLLPRVCPSQVGGRSAQPLADCSCQAVLEPSSKPSQSPRFPEAPQDPTKQGGQGGACAERRAGWAGPGPARWGDAWMDQLLASAPRTSWTPRLAGATTV